MATFEANVTRRANADARLRAAVDTLTERFGIDRGETLQPPRVADPEFRSILDTEALVDTLDQIVTVASAEPSAELLAEQEAMDGRVRIAVMALADHAGVNDLFGVAYPEDASFPEQRLAMADAVVANLEAIVAVLAPESGITPPAAPDLSAMTRDELDALATSLGIADADKLPNKAAVVDAITAAREA